MGFNKAFADFAVAFFKIEITGLAIVASFSFSMAPSSLLSSSNYFLSMAFSLNALSLRVFYLWAFSLEENLSKALLQTSD